nr:MAG TPA: hypothetical protein [Caudoviricetes sp.]
MGYFDRERWWFREETPKCNPRRDGRRHHDPGSNPVGLRAACCSISGAGSSVVRHRAAFFILSIHFGWPHRACTCRVA